MNETKSGGTDLEVAPEALRALPIFPLPGTLLLPQTLVSLHVFEPRYRRMMDDIADGHRALAIAMLDEEGLPDAFGRPPVLPIACVGKLRRSARLPDGRFNILVEGVTRADIRHELDPTPAVPYRRVRARPLQDVLPKDPGELDAAVASLRALCSRIVAEMASGDQEIIRRLNDISDPGTLADMVAAAAIQEPDDRRSILTELDVVRRLELAAGALGTLVLRAEGDQTLGSHGWGLSPGKA